ncbi:hypothetical protein MWU78_20210 [Arenibacter sp. F26102]|uniref:hypothetical protein n=1 Tax=Arenibacter sp. F26102 TaxID=2926416 RepID=UPI001FF50E28|nr:hypothetical protein [Arenibacter sp. F26102]MCK0147981.1 hypothetical protein [Arenibacter sp. F26102]
MKGKNSEKEKANNGEEFDIILFKPWEYFFIGVFILLIIVAPIALTQYSSLFSFEDSGPIGDTIGGITSPFVNLLAAYLVFKSFSAQIFANAQQRKDHNTQIRLIQKEQTFNSILVLFNSIRDDYYADNRIEGYSYIRYISKTVNSYRDRIMTYPGQKKVDSGDAVMEINDTLKEPIETMIGQIRSIYVLQESLRKVELEDGFRHYYRNQIENILKDMDLWILINPAMTDKIEKYNVLRNSQAALYQHSKAMAESMQNGYTIRTPLGL